MAYFKKTLVLLALVVFPASFWGTNPAQAQTTGAIFNNPNSVFVSGNYAYVTSEPIHTLEIVDISDPTLPAHVSSIKNGDGGAVLHSPTSVAVSGNYAYVTSRFGNALEVLDVSDPTNPVHVSTLSHGDGGAVLRCPTSISISGNYAYMVSTGCGNSNPTEVEIVDISDPTTPTHVHTYFVGLLTPILSITVSGNYLYVTFRCLCNGGGGMQVVDISNPTSPVFKGGIFDGTDGANLFYPTDIYVSGDYAYVSVAGNVYSLEIFDVSDPTNVVYKGSIHDGDGGAELLFPNSVFVSGNYAYITTSVGNDLEIVNVSDPTNPTHAGKFDYTANYSYPYDVVVSGNYAYVTLIAENALDIIDISNPSNPIRKGILRNGELVGVPPAPTHNPVIIIPGIMGSELYDGNDLIWPDTINLTTSITDNFLDILKMDNDGLTINNVVVGDVLKDLNNADYFQGLINLLVQQGYEEGTDLFLFPYDWRLDIEVNKDNLTNKIEQIRNQTHTQKINVISHSMGGLLLKYYLKQDGGNVIRKFIDIATPQLGSSNAFKTLMYGDNLGVSYLFGLVGINSDRIKTISQNMPSVYQLLPTREYFNLYPPYVSDLDDLDSNGIRGSLNYDQTKTLMQNMGRNSLLLERADQFHQEIAGLDPADYGVETYNIVGCGVQTLGKIFVLNKETSGDVEYNISYTNGDGTVPLKSAESIPALRTYYAKNAVHATMPSLTGIKELIASILADEELDISLYPNLAESANGCTVPNGRIVSFHSPIELHIYSGDKHAGPNEDGDIEVNIPGVSYEVIDGNKLAFLPDGIEYIIKGNATGSGSFNVRIETIEDENVVETKYFNEVPLTDTTQVEIVSDVIMLDNNEDGLTDLEVQPSAVLDENQSSDITKPMTTIMIDGKKKDKIEPFNKPVKISFNATDDNSGILKTEYSLDNGHNWIKYVEPFTLSNRGQNKILYKSTDKAGNVESIKSVTIIINPPGSSGGKK